MIPKKQPPALTVHPYAAEFPMMPEGELQELAASIKRRRKLLHPIVTDDQDRIIDGRNRLAACEIAGVQPTFEPFIGTESEIEDFIDDSNVNRRHLEKSQRAYFAARSATRRAGAPKGNKNASQNKPAQVPNCFSQDDAAKKWGVSPRLVREAAKVQRDGIPELNQAVAAGEIKVGAAEKIATLPKHEQAAALAAPRPLPPRPVQSPKPSPAPATVQRQLPINPAPAPIASVAMTLAQQAVDLMKRVPANDPGRKRGFQFVRDFLDLNEESPL